MTTTRATTTALGRALLLANATTHGWTVLTNNPALILLAKADTALSVAYHANSEVRGIARGAELVPVSGAQATAWLTAALAA